MKNIIVFAAHQDDEVLGCGGALIKHIRCGDVVQVVFLSDGFSSREFGYNRDQAAKDVSKLLGCLPPIFINFPNNRLDTIPLLEVVKHVERIIADFQPDVVYTHHFGDLNIDHQLVHRAVMTACRPQPGFYVREIYTFEVLSSTHWGSPSMDGGFNPSYFIDISDVIEEKVSSLRLYDDEMRDYPHARSYESVRAISILRGSVVGLKFAEAFQVERLIR